MEFDLLGRELAVDDCVVFESAVWKIVKFNAKTITVMPIIARKDYRGNPKKSYVYGIQIVKVPAEDVTMWLLKKK